MKIWLLALAFALIGCGVGAESEAEIESEELAGESFEQGVVDALSVKVMEGDVAPGTLTAKRVEIITSAVAARALLGGATPSIDYSRNWLLAYRPAGKTATSRVVLTRAQLSATGKTLSLWATVTEPGAGCAPWLPNELALARVPRRPSVPASIRVYVTEATSACGLLTGPSCVPNVSTCPQQTPLCHGSFERADGSFSTGTCVKIPAYAGISNPCQNDAACGAGGICAGLATSQDGLCQSAWMRGTYSMPSSGQLSAPLPQGGAWHRAIVTVAGQATVPMDAWVQTFADDIAPARVEWRLINPSGTASSIVRGTQFGARLPVFVPGDESINGEWVFEVRDVGTSAPGRFRAVRLSFTSRWD